MDSLSLRSPQHVNELPQECSMLHTALGVDIHRRDNLHMINSDTIVYTQGNAAIFHNLNTNTKTFVQGLDSGGIGCVCVHPTMDKFAIGGHGFQPRIFVYSYPDVGVLKKLSAGAERGYASIAFNASGTRLVSVSSAPDFMLTVWDWEEERILLHSKAFGQDVFFAKFSIEDEGRLTTCGTGHIRFWKMASTFTGQKLQGLIGKFGKVELSDVAAFVELPDGKVLSGTESGAMLLWEGNFIKARLVRANGKLCHEGEVNYIDLDRRESCVISAGEDGYIRLWDLKDVESSEAQSDASVDVVVTPLAEYCIGMGTGIKELVDAGMQGSDRQIVLLDTKGRLLRLLVPYSEAAPTLQSALNLLPAGQPSHLHIIDSFHAGAITGMDTCPTGHIAATCGADGVVKYWNYAARELVDSREYTVPATCLCWAPSSIDSTARTFAVGFADGIVRRMAVDVDSTDRDRSHLSLVKAYKPHNMAVTDISFSSGHKMMFTAGRDGIVFVFKCFPGLVNAQDNWLPAFFVTVAPETAIICESLSVHPLLLRILCSCDDGITREIFLDGLESTSINGAEEITSYEKQFPVTDYIVKIPQTSVSVVIPEDGEAPATSESELEPWVPKVKTAVYALSSTSVELYVSTEGEKTQVFGCAFVSAAPKTEIMIGNYSIEGKGLDKKPVVTVMGFSKANQWLLTGASDGSFTIRTAARPELYVKLQAHSSAGGGVSCITSSFDGKFVLSAGHDGSFVVHRVNSQLLIESALLLAARIAARDFGESLSKPFEVRVSLPRYLDVVSTTAPDMEGFERPEDTFKFVSEAAPMPVDTASVDITSDAYSIQDAKLKSEMDAKRKVAEELKTNVRAAVKDLRNEYEYILKQNDKIPAEVHLPLHELEVDTAYMQYLKATGEDMVLETHKECAYGLEKSEALVSKLRSRLMDLMLVEEMPLKSLDPRKKKVVFSLRVRGIDNRVQQLLDAVEAQVKSDQLEEAKKWAAKAAQKKAAKTLDDMQKRNNKKDGTATQGNETYAKHGMTSAAIRHDFRRQRKAAIDKHLAKKPNKEDDDVQDVEAILRAQETLGDFKLKCADEYEVPEDQRINAQQKKRQLALLEESTVSMRLRFNQRFFGMRQLKRQMIYNICKDNARVREINEELNEKEVSATLWEPQFDPREYPDDRYEVTDEELTEYASSRRDTGWKDSRAPVNQKVTGAKTFIQCDWVTGRWSVTESVPASAADVLHDSEEGGDNSVFACNNVVLAPFLSTHGVQLVDAQQIFALEKIVPCLRLAKASLKDMAASSPEEQSLVLMKEDRRRTLMHERKMLLEKTSDDIASFDDALDDLRLDRHTIVSNLKLAELKLLVLYQEYELLLTFEGKDISLQQKLLSYQKDKAENISSVNENQGKLNIKNEDLKQWQDKVQRISDEYKQNIADTHPSAEILGKIFRKKIKRAKANDGDDDDDYEDDDDDDYEEDDDDVEDVCPPGCELNFYEKVLELRNQRLDAEESMAEVVKRIDELKKTLDRFKQREKQIDKDLKQTGAEIQQFQQQKQASLNKIDVVVPLCISQVFAFETSGQLSGPKELDTSLLGKDDMYIHLFGTMDPVDEDHFNPSLGTENRTLVSTMTMQSHVVIRKQVLERLKSRVRELINECNEARASYKSLHKDRSRLEKAKDSELEKIAVLNAKATSLQLHKFGRIVDLDSLEGDSQDTGEDAAEVAARLAREQSMKVIDDLEKDSDGLKDRLAEVTKVNTELLKQISSLLEQKAKIVSDLRAPGVDVLQDNAALMQEEEEEGEHMVRVVAQQAREIEAMKAEIFNLKRKEGTHIVPAIPAPSGGLFPPIPKSRRSF